MLEQNKHKIVYYYLAGALALLVFLKVVSSKMFEDLIQMVLTMLPFIIIAAMIIHGFIKYRQNPEEALAIRKHILMEIFFLLLTTLLFYILYSPQAFAPTVGAFAKFGSIFSLDAFFVILSYVSVGIVALSIIFVFYKFYRKSQGKYQGSMPSLIRKTLYSIFFVLFFFLISSAAIFPGAYSPITDFASDMFYLAFKGSEIPNRDEIAQKRISSLKNVLGDTFKNLTDSLGTSTEKLTTTVAETKDTLDTTISRTSASLKKTLSNDIENRLDISGGTLAGDLTVEDDLNVEGLTTTQDIVPSEDDAYDLGSVTDGWNALYIHSIHGSSIITIGDGSTSHSISNTDDLLISGDLEVNGVAYLDGGANLNSQKITGLGTPTADTDAATKAYVDTSMATAGVFERVVTTLSPTNTGDNLDMENGIIMNIGNGGTDFTSGGGLTLAGGLTLNSLVTGLLEVNSGVVGLATAGTDYENPLTFSNSLSRATNTVTLVNDSASPGNSYYYGTNGSGTKGWYAVSAGVTDHSLLSNLDISVAGHTGFEPAIAAGTTAQYYRGDESWQTLNQAAVAGLTTADGPTFATINTGQGDNDLYDMNQNVQTTDAVTFATINTGEGNNELFDMNQNVQTSDAVTFAGVTSTSASDVPLIINNSTGTQDIFQAKANGVAKFKIEDDGRIGFFDSAVSALGAATLGASMSLSTSYIDGAAQLFGATLTQTGANTTSARQFQAGSYVMAITGAATNGWFHGMVGSVTLNNSSADVEKLFGLRAHIPNGATWTGHSDLGGGINITGAIGNTDWDELTGAYVAAYTKGTSGVVDLASGIHLEKQTIGTVNSGIILDGDGVGSDLVLGDGQDAKIYYDGTDLIIDPNVVGTGKVLIGATGNDTLQVANIGIGIAPTSPLHVFSSSLTSGILSNIDENAVFSSSATISSNLLSVTRAIDNTENEWGDQTVDVTGAVAVISDTLTNSGGLGVISSSADVLRLQQNYTGNTGAVLNIAGGGADAAFALRINDDGTFTDSSPLVVDNTGQMGVGITAPAATLHVVNNEGAGATNQGLLLHLDNTAFAGISSTASNNGGGLVITADAASGTGFDFIAAISSAGGTDDAEFRVRGDGEVYGDGAVYNSGADYAEFFYTKNTDLSAGELVCVDVANSKSVKRCERANDLDLIGIISTKPAFVGNNIPGAEANLGEINKNYKLVGLIGQVPAKVSNENGKIQAGDSLTSASKPGYAMKANAGDSTVGVALENSDKEDGVITVLISRRNKSLTVEQVEEETTRRIAEMNIEDEVNALISDKINVYDRQLSDISLNISSNQSEFDLLEEKAVKLEQDINNQTDLIKEIQEQMADIKEQNKAIMDFFLAINPDTLLYKNSDGNLDLLSGKLIAQEVETGGITITVADEDAPTIGKAKIEIGESSVTVKTKAVKENSKIFVAPLTENPVIWSISEKDQDKSFTVKLSESAAADISFDWWIVDSR